MRAAPVTKAERTAHVKAIQSAVEAALPEDEPDDVRPWVYELAVKVMAERLGGNLTDAEADRDRLWTALVCLKKHGGMGNPCWCEAGPTKHGRHTNACKLARRCAGVKDGS